MLQLTFYDPLDIILLKVKILMYLYTYVYIMYITTRITTSVNKLFTSNARKIHGL